MNAASPRVVLDVSAAEQYIADRCFTAGPAGRVGLEIEHIVHDAADWSRTVAPARLDRLIAGLELPAGGQVTREPGGQLELSTVPHPGPGESVAAAEVDLAELYRAADLEGLRLLGEGTDPFRAPERTLHQPRYDAMESYFDAWSPAGRQMMCSTAAVQVTVEAGDCVEQIPHTWQLLHALGPTLVAMFANSPFLQGRATGWKCNRQQIWWSLDPARTRPAHAATSDLAPADEYAHFALNSPVMLMHDDEGALTPCAGFTFLDWTLARGAAAGLRPPTEVDLAYHLSTLFPPVRARGAFEVRYIDAQPGRDWALPVAVLCGLLDDAVTRDRARDAVAPVVDRWTDAARVGLADFELQRAASTLTELAHQNLARQPATVALARQLESFAIRYVDVGRCPADELLGARRPIRSTTDALR